VRVFEPVAGFAITIMSLRVSQMLGIDEYLSNCSLLKDSASWVSFVCIQYFREDNRLFKSLDCDYLCKDIIKFLRYTLTLVQLFWRKYEYSIVQICIAAQSCQKKCIHIYFSNMPWRPIGLWDVEESTFSGQLAHRWRWDGQPYASAALYPQEDSWYSFLLEAESAPGP
jgi:hypothetical protein